MNDRTVEAYRKARAPRFYLDPMTGMARLKSAPAWHALDIARATMRIEATREQFAALGGYVMTDRFSARDNADSTLRIRIAEDFDPNVLDFDCCPDPATGTPVTGARWEKCSCVIPDVGRVRAAARPPRRLRARRDDCMFYDDVRDASDNARRCQYGQTCKHKCDEARRMEREGACGVVAEVREADVTWTQVDSVWGFVGDDWRDSGYDEDAMRAAIDAWRTRYAPRLTEVA